MFQIDFLPAKDGDCLWIEYGDPVNPHRILIDGGRAGTYSDLKTRFANLPRGQKKFELLILTHIDADHIEGLLKLLDDSNLDVSFKDVWFNGYVHLSPPGAPAGPDPELEAFGARQAEVLSERLNIRGWKWNNKFGGKSVVVPDGGDLPSVNVPGGLELLLVSPTWRKLEDLIPKWEKECAKHGVIPGLNKPLVEVVGPLDSDIEAFGGRRGPPSLPLDVEALADAPFAEDESEANGSSIALVASFNGKSALLTGDAHPDLLRETLGRLPGNSNSFDMIKLPHHGSQNNVSKELVESLDCPIWVFSTSGSRHFHPDPEAVARIVKYSSAPNTEIAFNYRSDCSSVWDDAALKSRYGYETCYPQPNKNGEIRVILDP